MARVLLRTQAWGTVTSRAGDALPNLTFTIKNTDGSAATHYSAETGGTSSTSNLVTDTFGGATLSGADRWVAAGEYDITVNGSTYRVNTNGVPSPLTLTAATDSQVPLSIKPNSGTQSADLLQILPVSNSGTAVRATGQTYIDSLDTTQSQLLIQVPAYPDASISALKIIDPAANTNAAPLLEIAHHGNNATGNQSYGLAIHNYPTADSAFVIHQYSGLAPAIWIDQCSSAASLRIKQAENPVLAPGTHGNGTMLELFGYNSVVSSANGVVTGTNTLTDTTTPAAFTNNDVGKPITVAAVTTTIATVASATQVTTAGAIVNGSGVTYSYSPYSTVAQSLAIKGPSDGSTANPPTILAQHPAGLLVTTTLSAPTQPLMSFNMPAGGPTNTVAVRITQNTPGPGLSITQNAANQGFQVTSASGATGFYSAIVNGYSHGLQVTTNATPTGAGHVALQVTRNNTSAGIAVQVINKGTGNTQEWKIGAGPTMAMQLSGLGSLVLGQGAALATTATDGFLYIPTCAGVPTGVPTAFAGSVAMVYDTTDHKLYIRDGASWLSATFA